MNPSLAQTLPSAAIRDTRPQPLSSSTSKTQRLWSWINRHPGATLSTLTALYLAIACTQAATKLLWGDELITLAVARQGTLAAIWHALAIGCDPNPPLMHLLVLLSTNAFGQSALAIRLPAILCVLLAILSLWNILRRWVAPGLAALGVLAFMATRGFDYAYDARSYAGLLGFAMASLALWISSADLAGWRRFAALTGMAAALALGLSSNYYGVLAFFPIAAGEAVRTARSRHLQPGVWLAMLLAALPLLAYLPLIHHNIAEFTPHAWNRPQAGMIVSSYLELVEGVFWPALALAIFAALRRRNKPPLIPTEALAAIAVLLAYPFLGFAIASAGAGMVSPRCVVPVCCGFGIAIALLCSRLFGQSARAGIVLLSLALLWVVARESACAFVLAQQKSAFFAIRDQVAELAAKPAAAQTSAQSSVQTSAQPIYIADSLFALPLAHYSTESVRARIVFPIDFAAIHRDEKDDSGEQNLWAGRAGIFPIQIASYDDLRPNQPLLLIARPDGWLAHRLQSDHFRLATLPVHPDSAWQRLGGIFTPMAHDGTGISLALPQLSPIQSASP